ncbi:MAG TPA: small basic family protein [Armatimonadota bacterium]|nr:small basic family protein [Armatimonadota bacterium]
MAAETGRQRANRAWLPILGFLAGFGATYYFAKEGIPLEGAEYLSLAVLAGLDSVFGGIRAGVEQRFRSDVFLSGFLVNMVLAVLLVWLGKKIGVDDLWLAAVVTLGGRMFLNLSVIRRHWLERHTARGEK